jgi:hypothetical protein
LKGGKEERAAVHAKAIEKPCRRHCLDWLEGDRGINSSIIIIIIE